MIGILPGSIGRETKTDTERGLGVRVHYNNVPARFAGDFQTLVDALDEAEVALVLENGHIRMAARKRLQHPIHVWFTGRIVDDDQETEVEAEDDSEKNVI